MHPSTVIFEGFALLVWRILELIKPPWKALFYVKLQLKKVAFIIPWN